MENIAIYTEVYHYLKTTTLDFLRVVADQNSDEKCPCLQIFISLAEILLEESEISLDDILTRLLQTRFDQDFLPSFSAAKRRIDLIWNPEDLSTSSEDILDLEDNQRAKMLLDPAEQNNLADEINSLIMKHFPENLVQLTKLSEFKKLIENYFIPFSAKIAVINERCFYRIYLEWLDLSFSEILSIRKDSFYDSKVYYSVRISLEIVKTLISRQLQDDATEFIINCLKIIDKLIPKRNTLSIVGGAGCGKTYFCNSIATVVWSYGMIESQIDKTSNFPYESLYMKRMGLIKDFICSESEIRNLRDLFEGNNFNIPIKYKKRDKLQRTPIFMTSNLDWIEQFPSEHRPDIEQRVFNYKWTKQPWLKELKKQIHPMVWLRLVAIHEKDTFFTNVLSEEKVIEIAAKEHNKEIVIHDNETV